MRGDVGIACLSQSLVHFHGLKMTLSLSSPFLPLHFPPFLVFACSRFPQLINGGQLCENLMPFFFFKLNSTHLQFMKYGGGGGDLTSCMCAQHVTVTALCAYTYCCTQKHVCKHFQANLNSAALDSHSSTAWRWISQTAAYGGTYFEFKPVLML